MTETEKTVWSTSQIVGTWISNNGDGLNTAASRFAQL